MTYYSLNNKSHQVSFQEAVINGLAPDKGLYFPSSLTPISDAFFETIETLSNQEIAFEVINQFIGNEIPEKF
jgi:threonine synthase